MKCKICRGKAVLNLRHHNMALCKEHFLNWVPKQVEKNIKRYQMFTLDERILVAVSGGKDSLALWEILNGLGYQVDGLYIGLGIDGGIDYSQESYRLTTEFAQARDLHLHVVDVEQDYGMTIPEMAELTNRGKNKPCSICGLNKRHIMNRVAREHGYDVLATGHNLDDEAAVLFNNTLSWSSGYLLRQNPVLDAKEGLVRKVKPLCRMYEREMAAYALLRDINYMYEECPHAAGAKSIYLKELLNQIEADRPGAKLVFYTKFLKAKQQGLFNLEEVESDSELHPCPTCGQPTSAPENCSFCNMMNRVKAEKQDPN